ncbi:MAG: hypothetical protein IJO10_06505 [Clostridia bacterium]|nr:hypothetical protein [Clostridia bacterium]
MVKTSVLREAAQLPLPGYGLKNSSPHVGSYPSFYQTKVYSSNNRGFAHHFLHFFMQKCEKKRHMGTNAAGETVFCICKRAGAVHPPGNTDY